MTPHGPPVRWSELDRQAPAIAAAGRELLYQYGPGLASYHRWRT